MNQGKFIMTETVSQVTNETLLEQILSEGIISNIGNTPLISLSHLFDDISPEVSIYGKAEWFNPGGSVKDRPAWNMIRQGLVDGTLTRDKTIIDASSGNTGIALAMVGAALGIPVTISIPENATKERLRLLRAYGTHLELTDPEKGMDGAITHVRELVKEQPDQYFYTDQYNNENNWKAHYMHTSEEIFSQTNGKITHFVTGVGTSGTFTGVTRKLREKVANIECISIQPDSPMHGIEGMKHMETAIRPGIYDDQLADRNITVSTDEAYTMVKRLAREMGMLVGKSSGANVVGAGKIASELDEGVVVTILCDRGERYLTDELWQQNGE